MKLELKHLSPYLPYGLKVTNRNGKTARINGINWELDGHSRSPVSLMFEGLPKSFGHENLDNLKPLLRPLSDLTKEIDMNGERFVPMNRLTEIFGGRDIKFDGKCFYVTRETASFEEHKTVNKQDVIPTHFSQYDAFQKLFEWHFDVFGLIENGLAIDINTINEER